MKKQSTLASNVTLYWGSLCMKRRKSMKGRSGFSLKLLSYA